MDIVNFEICALHSKCFNLLDDSDRSFYYRHCFFLDSHMYFVIYMKRIWTAHAGLMWINVG